MRATAQIDDFGDISLLWRWLDGADYERILDADGIEPDYLHIPSYSYFDLTYRARVADIFTLTLSVQNLLDKDPPLVSNYVGTTTLNSGNTYPTTYDVLGRRYSLTASMRF